MAEDINESLTGDSNLSSNDILDALKDEVIEDNEDADESESDDTEESDEEGSSEEHQDEEAEPEEEQLEIKDEDDPELEYHEVPNRQAILKTYPDIFKKFPGIERAIYRESEYTKVFPSINEAKQAQERLNTFSRLENDVFSGDISNLLSSVKSSDPKAFGKISGSLLSTLAKVDKDAYFNTVNYVIKTAIKTAFDSGKSSNSEDGEQLQIAAQLLNRFIYNTADVTAPEVMQFTEEDPRAKELSQREQQFNERQLQTAVNDVKSRTESTIESAINKYIDPKNMMTSYTKDKAVKDVLSAVNKDLMSDPRFRTHLDRLWVAAQKDGYSDESKKRIRDAVIKKAQSTLPGFIKSVRAKALKNNTQVKRVIKRKDDEEVTSQRRVATPKFKSDGQVKVKTNSLNGILKALE